MMGNDSIVLPCLTHTTRTYNHFDGMYRLDHTLCLEKHKKIIAE